MYHAPWRQWVALNEIQHTSAPNWHDAELVEAAWKSMLGKHKLILKYTYMTKLIYNIQRDGWVLYRIRGRDCAISSWRIWLNIFKLPFLTFTPNTKAWFLSAVSLFGQIRGRSLKLVEKIHD